jgi:hypothetical protein
MLDRRQHERTLARLAKVSISGALPPSVSLIEDLVKFLNEARRPQGKRIVLIVEQMLEIDAMTRSMEGIVWPELSLKKSNPEKFKRQWEVEMKTALLRKELSRYRFIPCAEVGVGGNGGASEWFAWWRGESHQRQEKHLRMIASEALELVLKLTQIGQLTRLRHCVHCQKWLYAKFRHQTFCSMKCQQKHYTQTDEWRAKRRQYMRKYYRANFGR